MARGMYTPPARWVKSQDRIAQRPQMARSTRFAESTHKLELLWALMLLRGARPFKAKHHLNYFNNKCLDFKPMIYILILIDLNPGTSGLWMGESINTVKQINVIV